MILFARTFQQTNSHTSTHFNTLNTLFLIMFDELWSEIQDMPGEIFDMDIPELRDDNKFDVEEYIKGDTDY